VADDFFMFILFLVFCIMWQVIFFHVYPVFGFLYHVAGDFFFHVYPVFGFLYHVAGDFFSHVYPVFGFLYHVAGDLFFMFILFLVFCIMWQVIFF